MSEQPQTDPEEFARAIGRLDEVLGGKGLQDDAEVLYPTRVGEKPVTQTWVVTGVRCRNGEEQYEAGPETRPDGTQAYLSLPDHCVEGEPNVSDVWLDEPRVTRHEGEPHIPARHSAVRVWQERPGEVSWRCSCGLSMKHQRLDDARSVDLICLAANEFDPSTVVEGYQRDLAADIRTRIADAMTVTGADVLHYIEHGTWTPPRHSEHRECAWCNHYHLCEPTSASGWICHTCAQGRTCLG